MNEYTETVGVVDDIGNDIEQVKPKRRNRSANIIKAGVVSDLMDLDYRYRTANKLYRQIQSLDATIRTLNEIDNAGEFDPAYPDRYPGMVHRLETIQDNLAYSMERIVSP